MHALEKPNKLPGAQTELPVRTYSSMHWHTLNAPQASLQMELGKKQSVFFLQIVSVICSSLESVTMVVASVNDMRIISC